jgi:adenylate cyclase class IV
MPLLFWQLDAISPETMPSDILDELGAYFRANNIRNLSLTRELLRLSREVETRGIPVIPYKGPILAALAYGNLALREFGDLDVLVRTQDVLRAKELLASFGYRPAYRLTRAQEAAYIRYGDQYPYVT